MSSTEQPARTPDRELLSTPTLRVEIETIVNGGAPSTSTFFFDIVNDSGAVDAALPGLSPGDIVQIVRIDTYDPNGDRFSTAGVRIKSP